MKKKQKILVTGGAGFIGSHIVEALVERGDEVIVYDNLSTGAYENLQNIEGKYTFVEGDICDTHLLREACKEIDMVVHQAAIASVPKTIDDPLVSYRVNVLGTRNVFESACRAGATHIVYASSAAVYGDSVALPKKESMPVEPKSPYALHKCSNEYDAMDYAEKYGVVIVGLRYFNVFGERQDPSSPYSGVISKCLEAFVHKRPFTIYGDGSVTRDFVSVYDVVSANVKALELGKGSAVYNVGTGVETSIRELVSTCAKLLAVSDEPQYEKAREGDVMRSVADIEKTTRELMWEPCYNLNEGLNLLV